MTAKDKSDLINYTVDQIGFAKDESPLVVGKAKAGTGKTTSCKLYAMLHPSERILYLVYNRANRDEAVLKFPRNVVPLTIHQVAYAAIGGRFAHKLAQSLRLKQIAAFLDAGYDWDLVKRVQNAVNTFMVSSDPALSMNHIGPMAPEKIKRAEYILSCSQKMWSAMSDPANSFPALHDVYLKLYQLSKPELHNRYDTILVDEYQDTNPVTNAIVKAQASKCKLRLVGDEFQQIYRWRGAENALDKLENLNPVIYNLTNSFRFGQVIADVANSILFHKHNQNKIIGSPHISSYLGIAEEPLAIIHRTVFGTIEAGIEAAKNNTPTLWIGGLKGYNVSDLLDVFYLYTNEKDKILNKRLSGEFRSFDEYKDVAKKANDHEMLRAVKIVEKYYNLPKLIDRLRLTETQDPDQAVITLTTAHRAKGLEFPSVRLGDDFPCLLDSDSDDEIISDEINLLYVASTRAINDLECNDAVLELIDLHESNTNLFDERKKLEAQRLKDSRTELKNLKALGVDVNDSMEEIVKKDIRSMTSLKGMF